MKHLEKTAYIYSEYTTQLDRWIYSVSSVYTPESSQK